LSRTYLHVGEINFRWRGNATHAPNNLTQQKETIEESKKKKKNWESSRSHIYSFTIGRYALLAPTHKPLDALAIDDAHGRPLLAFGLGIGSEGRREEDLIGW
jgi:hypothetical protein